MMNGLRITSQTLMVADNTIPHRSGNCFSVLADNGKDYRIVNFKLENLLELLQRGLTYPIEIERIGGGAAVIKDDRIGGAWYTEHYCPICLDGYEHRERDED